MKRYPPKRILIPAVLVVPWIVFIHGCSRPDPAYTEARIITFQAENHVSGTRSHTASAGEPGPDRREISFRASVNNLIIPGRVTRSAEFIPGKNLNITVGGASLEIPPGGMKEHCAISVTGLLAEDLPPIPPEITTVTAGYYAGYRFLPHGKLFDSPATIALQYDKNLIPPGYSPDDIFTFWFDEDEKKWKALDRDTVDIDRGMIISATNHFTDMINGIITIPESPQTSGFVPTSVNDIRVAEPSAGITLMEPPVANNEGDASLSFPLKIPAGRTGLQPQLLLMYSSDMGSGWLGYGWDITVPAISVDITWGVPRYLSDRESETYLLQGSQLTPVAHRGDYIDRVPEKRFHSRRESDFSRIIRHGDHPSNYWWEVTTKDGVRNFYGGTPSGGIAENAVSMDQNGNIGYWALVETRDLDDNFVSYKYDKPAESGQETYIREISYTGHGAEEGAYKISFLKLDEENNFERKDFRIDARYGFIKRDNQLLRRINITYNEEPVRSYTFHYKAGEFMKSLLSDVTEINSAGERFYSHRFSYYNDVQSGGIYVPYGPEMTKILPDDKLKEPLLNPVNFFFDNVSALGGSASMGFSGGTSVTVGLLDGNLATKDNTAGGNFSYQSSDNEAFLSFIDLNGDGLPDKVYKKNNKVYYRPNLLSYPNDNVFGAEKLIDGISRIGYSKTSGFSGGIEANPFQAFAGSDFGSTTTKTSVYFTDFNGDGLIDLASDGAVYFNHLENGVPVFSESSSTTPNPVYASSEIAPDILPDPAEEQAQLEAQFPLHDAVRLWKAPFEGSVIINAPVQLVKDTSQEAKSDKYRDGVKVSIQQNGNNPLWMAVIDSGNYSILPGPLPVPVNVNKGDRLYFRVQSRFNGSSDKVYWDPEIQYLTINKSDTLVNHKDSNRKIVGRYKASEDYVLCGQQSVGLPKDGQLRITASFSKEVTSDSLELFINYTDSSGHKSVIYHSLYTCEAKDNDPIDIYYDIIRNGFVQFSIVSSTSIDWSAIRFSPVIEYTRIDNDSIPVIGPDGKPVLRFAAIPEFVKMYNDPVRQELPVIVDKSFIKSFDPDSIDVGLYKIKITPGLTSISNVDPARTVNVILAVKQRDKILGEKEYQYLNGSLLAHDTLIATIQRGDTLFLEYYFPDNGLLTSADTTYIVIGPDSENLLKASAFSPGDTRDGIFGSMYRGWGQFDYKGDSFRVSSPIDEALLKMRDYSGVNISADTSALGNILNPIGEVFNIMIPYAETGYYRGTDNEVFVSGKYVSSSRLGENNVLVEPLVFPASGLGSVTKILKNSSTSVGGGLSFASISHTWGNDNITLDMIDMNGDMYPDLLSTNSIQYTDVRGVLSGPAVNHGIGDHYSKSEATGVTGGGNFANAKAANSLTPVTARGTKANTRNNFKTNNNAREAQESSLAAAGSIGVTSGEDHTDQTWLDINGDGLPDKVYNNGQVRLNLGYSFAPAETWNFDAICTGKSIDLSGGLGINIANGSIAAGVSISKSFNYATETFLDINADRLPDLVKGDQVYFNTGAGFASAVDWSGFSGSWPGSLPVQLVGAIPLEAGESIGEAANGGFTVGIGIPIIMIKICINPSASVNHGISRTLTQLADIDGDGMPDILSSGSEVNMKVKPSTIFRTNILKTVERPLGGSFTLDYLVTPAVYDHPGGKLALASVRVFDGLRGDGVDTTFTTFGYEGGYYDRHERQFLGFSEVSTNMCHAGENNSIYRTLIQSYSNRDYYSKGKMLSETLVDGSGNKQKGSENFYSLRDIHTGAPVPESDREPAFIALSETKKYTFEGSSGPRIITRETFEYDTLGNITVYTDSSGNANDLYTVSVKYHAIPELYVYCIPSLQEVITSEGLKRKSETFVNENGDITRISRYITGDRAAWFDLEYDEFGNLAKITRPANHKGERMWYKYEYDNAIHTYISRVTDAYGYTSSSLHDYRWGLPVENTDMNNQKIKYSHDEAGRLDTVTGPFELASGKPYTIAFEYFTDADVPYAHTMHYDSIYDSDIETYSFSDGFGRLVQTKKTALIFDNPNTEDKNGFIVSGKVMYDAFRRPVSSYQPVFEPAGNPEKYNSNPDIVNPTLLEYDVQDRIKRVTLPDGANMTHGYNVGYYKGEFVLKDSLVDALKNITVTFTKANGRQAATSRKAPEEEIYTSYGYNGIGELVSVTDPRGNISKSEYDLLGRRLSFEQPDAGLTEFIYDDAGNLTGKITASLRKQIPEGGEITYKYDHERLVEIFYPRNIQNRVNYTYGEPGASFNRAGRIVLVQDAAGGQEFFYGKLGEITKTIRTVQMGESDMRTWIWSAQYDTWNRVHTMTYPDGEKVIYSYNRAGNLLTMKGEKLGRSYNYISRLGYNKYEKQVYLKYGNGAETTCEYEPKLQRLKQMNVDSKNQAIMVNEYSYDFMGNILGITNSTAPAGEIGGTTRHSYSYDELYRLTGASGEFKGKNTSQNYSLAMKYDIMGNILLKEQTLAKDGDNQVAGTYSLPYKYEGVQPNAATAIGERIFTYDANGNPTGWQDTVTNDYRQLAWDEENRLTLISDNGYVSRYIYDASGSRVIKSHGGTQGVYINGAPAGLVNSTPGNYTVYVSPYFVFNNEKFTKHYYNGITRIASKTGNGEWVNQYRPAVFELTAGGVNYIDRQQKLEADRRNYVKASGVAPGPPTMKGIYTDPLNTGTAYPHAGTPDTGVPRGWPKQPVFAPPGGPPGAPIQWGDEVTNDNVKPGFGYLGTGNFEEILCYFYHPDHLGSTSYITSANGEITQFISYLPFGEVFTEQHSGWDSPNKFNAKELDSETGLYYYGARYYDPKTATWISPDPFAEKYPELSPYVYCHDNPVIFTDPDGKAIWITDKSDNNGKIVYTIHLTGKLINSTDKAYSPEKLQEYASRIKSSIESTYQGKGDGISWNTVVHIAVATENTPGTSDHEFKIVSKGKIPTGTSAPKYAGDDAKGRAPGGGKLIYISEDITESKPTTWFGYKGTGKTLFGGPTLERTAAHEFGHSAGLWHNWTEGNIMAPTIDKEAGMKIKADQFEQIRTKYRKGELNNSESK